MPAVRTPAIASPARALLAGLSLFALVALAGCAVEATQIETLNAPIGSATQISGDTGGLPVLGPVPNFSHWHAAYVVRICDDVLEPFDSDNDPLGIHSHGDGLMHVHPFFEESGYDNATIGLFGDAMGFDLADGELTLPGGGTWRDGDLCNGEPGRVFVDKWDGPDPQGPVTRLFTDLADIRYLADGELYQIGFAPMDSPPVVPPSRSQLDQVSNLSPPPDPWVDVPPVGADSMVTLWPIADVAAEPCNGDQVPESVLFGPARCFVRGAEIVDATDAIAGARAVELNRQPAVELRVAAPLSRLITDHFRNSQDPFAFAIEIDGVVVTAPLLGRPPVGDRIVISGGFTVDAAQSLADALGSPG